MARQTWRCRLSGGGVMARASFATAHVSLAKRGTGAAEALERWWGSKTAFGVKARVSLYKRLAKFAGRGTPVQEALEGMWQRYERRKDMQRHVFREIYMRLDDGEAVGLVMTDYVPASEAILIRAGEAAGSLETGFKIAAVIADGARSMRAAIWKKLAEPILLTVMLAAVLILATYYVMPSLLTLAPNVESWPAAPKMLHDIAFFVRDWGLVTLVALVAGGIGLRWLVPNWTRKGRAFCDRYIPPFTIYRGYSNAGFLLALGELTRNGTPIPDAVEMMLETGSPWLRWHLHKILRRLVDGVEPGRAIDVGMLDQTTMDEVEDYMRSSSFTDALASLGEDAVEEGIQKVNRATMAVLGISLVGVAFVMALIAIGPMMLGMHKMDQMGPGAKARLEQMP